MLSVLLLSVALAGEASYGLAPIEADRTLEVISEGSARDQLEQAGVELAEWAIDIAGVEVDGAFLRTLAAAPPDEPFLRAVRETFGRPIDLQDLVFLLDDVLVAGRQGRRGERLFLPAGRARSHGVLVHPQEVFEDTPRPYPHGAEVQTDDVPPPEDHPPARDGDVLGPEWTARFEDPADEEGRMRALVAAAPDFAARVDSLLTQLRKQGAQVTLTSTVRSRHRGYLMWGAFELGRATSEAEVDALVARLEDRNRAWGLHTPIVWEHPDGWRATREAARRMADAYDVVYATERGARASHHYGGRSADLVAVDLPRTLTLDAPDGATRTFDLSDPEHTRDLGTSPELIAWIEAQVGMQKVRSDYPHWNDARRRGDGPPLDAAVPARRSGAATGRRPRPAGRRPPSSPGPHRGCPPPRSRCARAA